MIHLYTEDSAELMQTKSGTWLLKHHKKGSCSFLFRFFPSKEEAEAALAYLATNGVLPPFPEDDPEDDIPY